MLMQARVRVVYLLSEQSADDEGGS
jgi:hypothetical protein